ncbi:MULTISPECIES: hypothetical protein [unclassified Kribbella]|uniref:hypothetical protein n=1 Tax=unclassified Kribbella TaxID=2644121 RepID=UPI00378AD4C3|nr:hypothetical protein OG817_18005 [Kribbella sp. NBC_00889]
MKHRYTILALPVLAFGAIVAGSAEASARPIDPDERHQRPPVVYVDRVGPTTQVQVDDNITEALQTGAGVLGGAGLAMAGLWAYRRRHPLAVH